MILAIDTSTRYGGVAIADGGRVVESRCWHSTGSHTAQLMPAVGEILAGLKLSPKDLTGIALSLGPGAFSALRVGMSVAKGLALANRRPLVGIGALDLEAFPFRGWDKPVCALLPSGRKEVASGLFAPDGSRIRPDLISPPEELLEEIAGPTIFCGEGIDGWEPLIRGKLGDAAQLSPSCPAQRVWALAALGAQRLEAGESDDLAQLQPYYLRMPSIGGPKRRDLMPQQSQTARS